MYKTWWKTIVKLMVIAMFFTAMFSLLIPTNYISTVTIISADSVNASSISSVGKLLGISGFNMTTSSNDVIIAILKSRRMAKYIATFLEYNKQPKFKYSILPYSIISGLIINIKGRDPVYTEKIANFAVQNLDKINSELNITPNKPMVKVLDQAVYGVRESKQIFKKVSVAAILAFLIMSSYIFLADYLKKIKLNNP